MTWQIDHLDDHETFERNPLVAVVVQLRFNPILKIGKHVADFQDKVRERFPGYAEGESEIVRFRPPSNVEVKKQPHFLFHSVDGAKTVTLGVEAVAIENRDHRGHREMLDDVALVVDSLLDYYGPIVPTRLGMRYINNLSRESIAKSLGKEVSWNDLVQPEFLAMPRGLATLEGTLFANEYTSPADGDGEALTLRYGLQPIQPSEEICFRFDTDRYLVGAFDPKDTVTILEKYVEDIYAAFMSMAGDELLAWMGQKDSDHNGD
jgi:uncharacterized protein (TIGR04255 family)